MGRGVARTGDKTRGHPPKHDPHGPRVVGRASNNVFVNGRPAARIGDKVQPSPVPDDSGPHLGNIASGSRRVYANGRGVARKRDKIVTVCREPITGGSNNVRAG